MQPPAPIKKTSPWSLFFGGLLPIILFTVIEDQYGTMAGLIAGLTFGVGEVLYEKIVHKKVNKITWIGNGLLVGFGLISLWTADGIWFKLQPALMESIMALILWGSLILKRPILATLAEAQGVMLPEELKVGLKGLTFRTGIFFLLHAGLATWAAFEWTTTQWALLKGLGLTLSFIVYLVFEGIFLRRSLLRKIAEQKKTSTP